MLSLSSKGLVQQVREGPVKMAPSVKPLHINHRFLVILLLVTDRKFSQMRPLGLHERDGELEEEIQRLVLVRTFSLDERKST